MNALVIGCGYLGMRVARRLLLRGHQVHAIKRHWSADSDDTKLNLTPLSIDITDPAALDQIPSSIQWAINTVSSSKRGPDVYRSVYYQATQSLIKHLNTLPDFQHYIHTSSTSVYGQTDGSWVDERAERTPNTETSRILVDTENLLLQSIRDNGFPASIARVSGIYGPQRGYLFQQFVQNQARMIEDGSRTINMIHVDDVAESICRLLEQVKPGDVYNVTDSQPTTQREFFTWLSKQLGKPLPPKASAAELSQRKRAITNKKVSNRHLLETLRSPLQYPSYRKGYRQPIQQISHSAPSAESSSFKGLK